MNFLKIQDLIRPLNTCQKHFEKILPKRRLKLQNKTETCTMCLFDNQILFCKRAGSAGINAIKDYLKRLRLVVIATILSKTIKIIHCLFMSAIARN